MDPEAVSITVIVSLISVILQTIIIVWLYNHYIIPRIVLKVKDEILIAIEKWVLDLKQNLNDEVHNAVSSSIDNLKAWISGSRGNDSRQITLAKKFLDSRLPPDQDPEEEDDGQGDVIAEVLTQGLLKFGRPILDIALGSVRPKIAAARDNRPQKQQQDLPEGWQ